jgi:hypothetical protein
LASPQINFLFISLNSRPFIVIPTRFIRFRYKAVMHPLSERTSRTFALLIIAGLWVSSVLLATPMLFFFELKEVFDESEGGTKG